MVLTAYTFRLRKYVLFFFLLVHEDSLCIKKKRFKKILQKYLFLYSSCGYGGWPQLQTESDSESAVMKNLSTILLWHKDRPIKKLQKI